MEKKTEVKASLLDKILAKLGVKTLEEAEQANYRRIKEEVKQIVADELERIAGDENLKHLLQQK